jgi:hypothetical protein
MSTLVDIGPAMATWVDELEFYRKKVKELENKVQVAKEIMAFLSGSKGIIEQKPDQKQQDSKPSIRSRVIALLAERQQWLTATEIAEILMSEGLKTKSEHINTLIATTANKLCEMGRIVRRKRKGRVQYAIPNLSNSGSGNTFEGQK